MKEKLQDYAANVFYLGRFKPKEVAAYLVIGFVIGFVL